MTHRMSTEIFKWSVVAFYLAQPIGGLLILFDVNEIIVCCNSFSWHFSGKPEKVDVTIAGNSTYDAFTTVF